MLYIYVYTLEKLVENVILTLFLKCFTFALIER